MGSKDKIQQRDSSLDLVRIVAFIGVISVHFFLHNGFYETVVVGKTMFAMTLLRSFFMYCVPLFLMLSGYLMNRKKLSKSYYLGVIQIVAVYIIASIFCLAYTSTSEPVSILSGIRGILDFSAAKYSWYIEMYLGLFLLIPFLNVMYHGLEAKRNKQILLATMLLLTGLPGVINASYKILPSWWVDLYPISYYFLGAYLCEYKPQISKRNTLIMLIVSTVVIGTFNYYMFYGGQFNWSSWQSWGSIFNVITTVLIFIFVTNFDTSNWGDAKRNRIQYIASLTLGGYLLSSIADSIVYPVFKEIVPSMSTRLLCMPLIVILVLLGSLALSAVCTFLSTRITRMIKGSLQNIQ